MHNFPAALLASCSRLHADPPLGDSSRFSIMQYEDWEDAKRGIISRRRFVKLHVLADARGKKIVSCEVTKGTAHDSPWFRRIFARVPGGAGCVMLDAAYDAYENCRVIRYSGRRPVIDPRKDHTLKGHNPRTEMLRWRKENPEEFERTYPAQPGRVRVLVAQGQVWRRSRGKDAPATVLVAQGQVWRRSRGKDAPATFRGFS